MKEYILVRHAQSLFNTGETDFLDSELSPLGIKQAVELSKHLKENLELEGCCGFVSPYRRTLQTAYEIHKSTGMPFLIFPLISEYASKWIRVPYNVKVERHNADFPMFDWSLYDKAQTFREENFEAMLDRLNKVLKYDFPNKILLVSHSVIVYTLIDLLTGGGILSEGYSQVTNASFSLIRENKPILLFKNEWKGS
jgi:broad specificity phosphatase PhoE